MNISLTFTRIFFAILSIFFMTTYMLGQPSDATVYKGLLGILLGVAVIGALIGCDIAFRKFNLRSFNIVVIGLFLGYLMGLALDLIFNVVLDLTTVTLSAHTAEIIRICLFLFGTYLGTILTLRSSDEFYISIPFVKFAPTQEKRKDFVIDASVLADSRIIDLCNTGILDKSLIVPRFVIKDLYLQIESGHESTKARCRKSLENLKKMEEIYGLDLRYNDTDFPEVKDLHSKFIRLARLLDANLLTADISRVEMASIEGIKIINIHTLSNALKPLMEAGEHITIKVQRYGKEPRQGIGYLDDGTMVVINGGGDYIGETIDAQVLSVKHTSSGRMVFCNAADEEPEDEQ